MKTLYCVTTIETTVRHDVGNGASHFRPFTTNTVPNRRPYEEQYDWPFAVSARL